MDSGWNPPRSIAPQAPQTPHNQRKANDSNPGGVKTIPSGTKGKTIRTGTGFPGLFGVDPGSLPIRFTQRV